MSSQEVYLSVVIPAYNEEERLPLTLEKTLAFLEQQPYGSEVIVVSDGSTDGTGEVVKRFQNGFSTLHLIEYWPNQGKGRAVKTGSLAARGECVLLMDADYSVPLEMLGIALAALRNGSDIAIGSRGMAEAQLNQRQTFLRELAGKAFGRFQNLWLGLEVADAQCGFKVFTRRAVRALFPRQRLDSVIYDGEILFLAKRAGFQIAEFPVEWNHDPNSRIRYNLRKSLAVFWELFKVRWLHWGERKAESG